MAYLNIELELSKSVIALLVKNFHEDKPCPLEISC